MPQPKSQRAFIGAVQTQSGVLDCAPCGYRLARRRPAGRVRCRGYKPHPGTLFKGATRTFRHIPFGLAIVRKFSNVHMVDAVVIKAHIFVIRACFDARDRTLPP